MKFFKIAFLVACFFSLTHGDAAEKYKQVRIFVPDKATLSNIWSTGIDYEGATGKIGGMMEFVAGEFELQELSRKGIAYNVVIEDLAKDYKQRRASEPTTVSGFGYGSMGGFYTLSEVIQQLDSMRLLHPNLITAKDSIGRSVQGRATWVVKIGSAQSAGKPEVLYTALHHAREPQGMMTVVYYMWWLLQSYGTNPEATYLVNNRQMYFIPVVNPDGYEYNRQTDPNGGGFWRKNRRDNGSGIFGVDLNRNYGTFAMWNADNGGSSTSPGSDTYRGTAPFSEPETGTIDAFMRSHNIKSCFNYHTYSNLLIFPWGYLSRENADSLVYREWAYDMTGVNRYASGTDQQTVQYSTRGNSDDYMFGDTTKQKTWAMTPEVGTTGFWPTQAEIFPLAIENLQMNKLLAYMAGHYPTVINSRIADAAGNNDGYLSRGESFSLNVRVKNKGIGSGSSFFSIAATSSSPNIQFSGTPVSINVQAQTEYPVSLTGTVAANAQEGVPVRFFVRTYDAQGFEKIDTLNCFIGIPTVLLADSASNGTSNWTTGTGWGITSNNHTPPSAFTDSPTGTYAPGANNSLTLVNAINLNTYNYAELKFWTKWAIEPTWDFATVEASSNNGTTWTMLRTQLSHKGSARSGSVQPTGSWGYDSYTSGLTWVEQSADLRQYVNQSIKIRFRVAADGADERDGFYVDDIRVYGYTTSVAPLDTGVVVYPASFAFNGATGRIFRDSLKLKNLTNATVAITLAESTTATSGRAFPLTNTGKEMSIQSLIKKLRPAFQRANITRASLQGGGTPNSSPQAYATILADERNENGFGSADIYRVQYQYRTGIAGNFHDFKIVLGNLPDTNVAVVLSIDTDQNFGTGRFPTPLGAGPTTRDIGSEFEVLLDASGILIDSLTPLGRTPTGVVVSTADDTLTVVGLPFLLNVQKDSVLTISTESAIGGINASWLNDPDRKMNLGFVASHLQRTSNPLPDYAPAVGHLNIGGETGVSWLTEDTTNVTIASNDSATIRFVALAATPAGTFRANVALRSAGRQQINVPFTMSVTTPPNPSIQVSPTTIRDTLALGDSVTTTLTVKNTGGGTLNFVVLDTLQTPWLTISPRAGTADSGVTANVSIKVVSTGLRTDTLYTVPVLVISNDPVRTTIPVALTLRVKRLTAVNENGMVPATFALYQNYPNPFNPETNISFDLPKNSFVTLKIFNLIGEEVATIVNAQLEAGKHIYNVSGAKFGLSSGVYLYKMVAGDFVQTKKMILMK